MPFFDAEPCTLAIVRRRDVPTPSPGPTLIDAVTYFSWLLRVGATGFSPSMRAVGVAGAVFAARTCGSAVDRYLAPLLAVVVTAAAEVSAPRQFRALIPAPAARAGMRPHGFG